MAQALLKASCHDALVLENRLLGDDTLQGGVWKLVLDFPGWTWWRPGQFVMLRPDTFGQELIWGRPISVGDYDDGKLILYYLDAGRGTHILTNLKEGDTCTTWGPLGNMFATEKNAPTLLLSGGIGIAPFTGYVRTHPAPEKLTKLFGHRLPLTSYPWDAFSSITAKGYLEKGPEDLQTFITALEEHMAATAAEKGLVLACGPLPFLRTVHRIAGETGVRCQVTLENRMGCGVGACLGCVAENDKGERVQSCSRGPVFWTTKITL